MENKEFYEEYYITVFSLALYKELKRHNIFPFEIQPNKKFPEFKVFKYHDSEETRKIVEAYKKEKRGG